MFVLDTNVILELRKAKHGKAGDGLVQGMTVVTRNIADYRQSLAGSLKPRPSSRGNTNPRRKPE